MSKHPIRPAHTEAALEAVFAQLSDLPEFKDDVSPVYTIREIARILKVSERTIFNLLKSGKLQSINILGARRIPYCEVERIARLGTFMTPEEIAAHYDRVDPLTAAWVKEEMARRVASRPDLVPKV
ncbi:MAG TPA: helix-turn-helix domain-containing protein [Terracidiphilus sp.]|jgi:excisionase family DNA binding protein|nr:helix-turn-helix domain-containing protein [Terracidiphilus sp.]